MFTFLEHSFYYETFRYKTPQSRNQVIQRLDALFTEYNSYWKEPNLRGHFVDYPESFCIKRKWSPLMPRSLDRSAAFCKGIIQDESAGQTTLEIAVRPNILFPLASFLFAIVGFVQIIAGATSKEYGMVLRGALLIGLGIPLMIGLARVASHGLRSDLEHYLSGSLRKNNDQ